jgi:hypothetical protein
LSSAADKSFALTNWAKLPTRSNLLTVTGSTMTVMSRTANCWVPLNETSARFRVDGTDGANWAAAFDGWQGVAPRGVDTGPPTVGKLQAATRIAVTASIPSHLTLRIAL